MPGRFLDESSASARASIRRSIAHCIREARQTDRRSACSTLSHLARRLDEALADFYEASDRRELDTAVGRALQAAFDAGFWRRGLSGISAKIDKEKWQGRAKRAQTAKKAKISERDAIILKHAEIEQKKHPSFKADRIGKLIQEAVSDELGYPYEANSIGKRLRALRKSI